jgi:hypothetical protein
MPPVITALYGALNAIFNIFLANNVSNMRRKHKVGIGMGEHPESGRTNLRLNQLIFHLVVVASSSQPGRPCEPLRYSSLS